MLTADKYWGEKFDVNDFTTFEHHYEKKLESYVIVLTNHAVDIIMFCF